MALRFFINIVTYMKSTVFSMCFFLSLPVSGQISDVINDQICSRLNIDKKTRPYFIDTTIQIGSIKIYSITPYPGGFSHLMPFAEDALLDIYNVSHSFNRIPYEFEIFENIGGAQYVKTIAYIETISYIKIEFIVLKISDLNIESVFDDIIYYDSKLQKGKTNLDYNSFEIIQGKNNLVVRKKIKNSQDLISFIKRHDVPFRKLPWKIKKKNKFFHDVILD